MQFSRSKTFATIMILMLTFSTVVMFMPAVEAQKTTFTLSTLVYPIIGVNSPTIISWLPSSSATSPLEQSSAYVGQTSVWANATATFTRPDNTTYVVNGPFKARPDTVQGRRPDVVLIWTPDMEGIWTVSFYWPGDDTYNEVNQTDQFKVIDHYEKRTTWAQLSMRPYPAVGVGQLFLINAWVTPPPYNLRDIYENYTFTFTSPTGSSTVVGPLNSEAPGTCFIEYALTELGDWDITFSFPGDWLSLPASVTRTITVQQDEVTVGYPDTPLPTDQWTFPINTMNREWRNIAGPWYEANYNASGGAWNPYTEAPRSAHVLWKISSTDLGGSPGGFIGQPHSIQTGSGEEAYGAAGPGMFTSTVPSIRTVMAGRGYYTAGGMIHCVDMRTGEELWAVEGSFNVGAIRAARSGADPVLYQFTSNTFRAYNAMTGDVILEVEGRSMSFWDPPFVYTCTPGTYDQIAEDFSDGTVVKWDTTGSSSNFTSRIVYEVPFHGASFTTSNTRVWGGLMVERSARFSSDINTERIVALNLTTGEEEYDTRNVDRSDTSTWIYRQGPAVGLGYGLFYFATIPYVNQGLGYTAFNAYTGEVAWRSEKTDYPWGNFWAYTPQACAYGMTFGLGYSGVYAFNVTNGDIVWHYIATDEYFEEPYASNIAPDGSNYASYSFGSTGPVVGGGIVFAPNTEHSPTFVYRGQQLHAIDAFTGEKVWSIKGIYSPTAVAYGILLASDSYNGYSYAFGKGESETTVSLLDSTINKGEPAGITGKILDMSPAQPGTPCIADAYMTEWMEYLHMQQPLPTDATGVPVELFAEKGGVTYTIGSVLTDCDGIFKYSWTPPEEGIYNVFAVFNGDDSYYNSYNITTLLVGPAVSAGTEVPPETEPPTTAPPTTAPPTTAPPTTAPPTTAPPTTAPPTTAPPTTAPFPTEIAIITAVIVAAVIGVAAYWVLRKRE